jgi:hypothetical protein
VQQFAMLVELRIAFEKHQVASTLKLK